jgi:hypothetical protein
MIDKIHLINLLRRYIVMTFQEFKDEAERRIKQRNDNLESYFKAPDYYRMASEFPGNSRVVTHDGDVIPGKASENYWRRVADTLNGTKLKFKNIVFEPREVILGPNPTENDNDFFAVEVTEFTFEANGQEYKGFVDPPLRHRTQCDWH